MDNKQESKFKSPNKKRREAIVDFFKSIKVEPIIFLNHLGTSLIGVQTENLTLEKACKAGSVFFGNKTFSDEICDNLTNGSFKYEQEYVQSVANRSESILLWLYLIPLLIFSLFVGAWSDIVGRKVLIILSLTGSMFSISIQILNAYFEDWPVEFLWIGALASLSGGALTFSLGIQTFIADSTTPKMRTLRMQFVLGLTSGANAIGHYFNSIVYQRFGYMGNFGLGFAFTVVVQGLDGGLLRKSSKKSIL